MIQLAITFGLIALFHFISSISEYVRSPSGQWLYITSYVVFLALSMGYIMSTISAYYKIESVLIVVGITVFVCLGVTLFSFQTKSDFTSCMGVLLVMSLTLLAFDFVCIFTYSRIMYTVYTGLGAVFFFDFLGC
ncbi:unnamed protein product [Rotaria sordida]|uniref:Uncharacterized protein n=1 Tax=Rotaria sordida TaxID=392033 RepID=A0A815UWL4_9BILA|nr:unnamed protein product [Rotaria sordida]